MIWNLVCDSSCDLRSEPASGSSPALTVVPMRLSVGEKDWEDNETLRVSELLDGIRSGKGGSSTACPAPGAFAAAFEAADCSLCFTISGALSGTYASAVTARDMVLEEHPEKKICVIDSKSTAGVLVLLLRRARELIEKNEAEDFEGLCNQLRLYQASLRTVFTLECYDNLIRNGRMNPLVGSLLHSLGIHVVADGTPQGTIHVARKARGEARTYQAIVELMRESKDCAGAQVVLSHCENLSGALRLKERILAELPVKDVTILSCRGLTTYYAMEKGLILGF